MLGFKGVPDIPLAQVGRTVDISNTFEIKWEPAPGGDATIDQAFLTKKQEQCEWRVEQGGAGLHWVHSEYALMERMWLMWLIWLPYQTKWGRNFW
jgi:hypothetical protein